MSLASFFFADDEIQIETKLVNTPVLESWMVTTPSEKPWDGSFLALVSDTQCAVWGGLTDWREVVKLFRQRSQTRANTEPSLIMTRIIIERSSNHSVKLQSLWSKEQKQGKNANSDTLWQPWQVSHLNGIQILGKTLFEEMNAFSEKTKFSKKYTVVELAASLIMF